MARRNLSSLSGLNWPWCACPRRHLV